MPFAPIAIVGRACVLPGALSEATAGAIARAESGTTALALLLVCPEFLRR